MFFEDGGVKAAVVVGGGGGGVDAKTVKVRSLYYRSAPSCTRGGADRGLSSIG